MQKFCFSVLKNYCYLVGGEENMKKNIFGKVKWCVMIFCLLWGSVICAQENTNYYTLSNQTTGKSVGIQVITIGEIPFFDIETILREMQFIIIKTDDTLTAMTSETRIICRKNTKTIEVSSVLERGDIETRYYKTNNSIQIVNNKYMVPFKFFISSRIVGVFPASKEITCENKWGESTNAVDVWKNEKSDDSMSLNMVSASNENLTICVDPRIELLTIVQYLSAYGEDYKGTLIKGSTDYSQAIEKYFGKYKDHKAVQYFKKLSAKKFIYDMPIEGMLYTSDPSDLQPLGIISERIKFSIGDREYIEFVRLLNDFVKETKFNMFYEENRTYYSSLVDKVIQTNTWNSKIKELETYLRFTGNQYYIVISPLSIGGYGVEVEDSTGKIESFYYVGGCDLSSTDYNEVFDRIIKKMVIDRMVDENLYQTYKYVQIYNGMNSVIKKQYTSWETCMEHYLETAIDIRLMVLSGNQEQADEIIKSEEAKGFVAMGALCKKLEQYERAVSQYMTFDEFYPILLNALK